MTALTESYRLHFSDLGVEFTVDSDGEVSTNFYDAEFDDMRFSLDEDSFALLVAMKKRACEPL